MGWLGGIREELHFRTETVARTVGAATLSKVPFRHLWLAKYSSGRGFAFVAGAVPVGVVVGGINGISAYVQISVHHCKSSFFRCGGSEAHSPQGGVEMEVGP